MLVLPGARFNLVAHFARLRLRRAEGHALMFHALLAGWIIQVAAGLLNSLLLLAWERIGFERMAFEAGTYATVTISSGMLLALFAAWAVNRVRSIDRVSRDVAGGDEG